MFKFLKETIKKGIARFTKKVEEEAKTEEIPKSEEISEKQVEGKVVPTSVTEKKVTPVEKIDKKEVPEEIKVTTERKVEPKEAEKPTLKKVVPKIEAIPENIHTKKIVEAETLKETKKQSLFQKLTQTIVTKKISNEQFENYFEDLEMILLENNVAVEVIDKIKDDLKKNLVDKPLERYKIDKIVEDSLKKSIEDVLNVEGFDLIQKIKKKKPFVICFIGINGSGKTTTIAKVAKLLMDHKMSVVIAAADTFRAASIEQLEEHGNRLKVKVIKHDYGADPAAVALDAIKHAEAKNIDVVLIDTAGRQHSNTNLMDEMKKIVRVAHPDLKIFVGESITGNDCVEQAKEFDDAITIDGIILSKADIDEKGGAAISVSYITKKPILYIGTGQNYDDLKKFDSNIVIQSLGLAS